MRNITVSQAIRELAIAKSEFNTWSERFGASNVYVENSKPSYELIECVQKLNDIRSKIINLKSAIAISNANTKVAINVPIKVIDFTVKDSESKIVSTIVLINTLSELKNYLSMLESLRTCDQAITEVKQLGFSETGERVSITTKTISTMTRRQRDDLVEEIKNDFNILNSLLETSNFTTFITVP